MADKIIKNLHKTLDKMYRALYTIVIVGESPTADDALSADVMKLLASGSKGLLASAQN